MRKVKGMRSDGFISGDKLRDGSLYWGPVWDLDIVHWTSLVCLFEMALIAVCEDNPVSRRVMESMVSKLGCRVVSHADGAEAVRCAMGDVKFDIIHRHQITAKYPLLEIV
jgi:hypothetical protein